MAHRLLDRLRRERMPRLPPVFIAAAFALGSLEHATGFILVFFHVHIYVHYPAWRHAAFAIVDALIALVAIRRPDRLFIPVLAFLIEQVVTHVPEMARDWQISRRVPWIAIVVLLAIFAATVAAAFERSSPVRVRNAREPASDDVRGAARR